MSFNSYSGNATKHYAKYGGFSGASASADLSTRLVGSFRSDRSQSKIAEEREDLLNTAINSVCLGWSQMENRVGSLGYKIFNNKIVNGIKSLYIPSELGGGQYFYHASIWVTDNEEFSYNPDGVCIEYGAYDDDGLSEGHENPVHYWQKNGLRFSKMTHNGFKNYQKTSQHLNLIDFLDHEKTMNVRELLEECCRYNPFQASNYALATNNCQDFVARCIHILGITRKENQANRGVHWFSKMEIPKALLDALEKEESDVTSKIAKVPIIGRGFGFFHGVIKKCTK